MDVPPTVKSWSRDARELWICVHQEFQLDQHHQVLLKQACELLTRAADARKVVAKEGLMLGTKVHPLVDTERNSINCARLVLREIGLDFSAVTAPDESVRIHRQKGYA